MSFIGIGAGERIRLLPCSYFHLGRRGVVAGLGENIVSYFEKRRMSLPRFGIRLMKLMRMSS